MPISPHPDRAGTVPRTQLAVVCPEPSGPLRHSESAPLPGLSRRPITALACGGSASTQYRYVVRSVYQELHDPPEAHASIMHPPVAAPNRSRGKRRSRRRSRRDRPRFQPSSGGKTGTDSEVSNACISLVTARSRCQARHGLGRRRVPVLLAVTRHGLLPAAGTSPSAVPRQNLSGLNTFRVGVTRYLCTSPAFVPTHRRACYQSRRKA